jgi:hypothetical protein
MKKQMPKYNLKYSHIEKLRVLRRKNEIEIDSNRLNKDIINIKSLLHG